jgi:hypothetical protein
MKLTGDNAEHLLSLVTCCFILGAVLGYVFVLPHTPHTRPEFNRIQCEDIGPDGVVMWRCLGGGASTK